MFVSQTTSKMDLGRPGMKTDSIDSIEWFIEAQAFLRSYDSICLLAHPPFPSSQSSAMLPVEFYDGRGGEGVGEEPNHTIARKPWSL